MNNIQETLAQLEQQFFTELSKIQNQQDLEALRIKYFGRLGLVSTLMQQLKDLSLEDKRLFGPLLNTFKTRIEQAFTAHAEVITTEAIKQKNKKIENFDVTAYHTPAYTGNLHPYTKIIERIEDIFITMGYEIADGPEVETEYHNFEALNIPADHPARDMQDTFWLTLPGMLMRTHTSSVEVHAMQKNKLPLAIIAPGRCYRNEATDASHDFMFMQAEGLLIDKNVSMAQLFATVRLFLQAIFERKDLKIRTRPSYFPFVEPGVEIDMSCPFCKSGCPICKKTQWIEICGAGLVHPQVLRASNINPEHYSGFAFGFGLTRLTMLKYGITDIRLLHSNKIDFLKQF